MRSFPGQPTAEFAPDVIVVGAGIIGCSVAYHLVQTGRKVLVLERDQIGAGHPTSRRGCCASIWCRAACGPPRRIATRSSGAPPGSGTCSSRRGTSEVASFSVP